MSSRRVRSPRRVDASLAVRGMLTAGVLGLVVVGGLLLVAPVLEDGLKKAGEDLGAGDGDGGVGGGGGTAGGAAGIVFGASEAVRGAGVLAQGVLVLVFAGFAAVPIGLLALPLGALKRPLLLVHLAVATLLVLALLGLGIAAGVSAIGPMYDVDRMMEI